jgi:Protein of unknown function (DUF3750)
MRYALASILLCFCLPILAAAVPVLQDERLHWSASRWDSAGLAPDPAATPEAVLQVYSARAFDWRGIFGVHSWISVKPSGAPAYTRYEVVGWGVRRGYPAVRLNRHVADGYWAGNRPQLLVDLRGEGVDALIEQVEAAIAAYPHADVYRLWPGPNSNTFVAHVGRSVPRLRLELPPTAVGKDYLPNGGLLARAPSGTGYQLSLLGLLGVTLALEEGVELNLLGLTVGVDLLDPALKLPGLGRIGLG